mmetsp:Transcript_42595/g.54764  ORF Transcript_42595/g.54764 Transcript_42595/m.54764 type:complete len:909 (+) Transcript_42595:96-2822(+)
MASLFYLLALKRGERGSSPDAEAMEHAECPPTGEAELRWVLSVAPFALHFCYMTSPCEMQLRAAQRGFWLLFTKTEALPSQPAFSLFARPGKATSTTSTTSTTSPNERAESCLAPDWWDAGACVVLAIRGTSDIYDVVTDIRTNPIPFPVSEGTEEGLEGDWTGGFEGISKTVAVQGMANAAVWLLHEMGDTLNKLVESGHGIVLTGHSLGGGVASLFGILLKNAIPNAQIRVVTFGCPACMDGMLAEQVAAYTTSVVLHDDVVPRISPRSVRSLVSDLLKNRERMSTLWRGDLDAVFGRAKSLWVPRWRDSFLRQDAVFARPAKGLLSPSYVDPSSNKSRPVGMAGDLHDGAHLRSKFMLVNEQSHKSKVMEENEDKGHSSVQEALSRGMEARNASVNSVGSFLDQTDKMMKSSDEKVILKRGDTVMAWGILHDGQPFTDNAKKGSSPPPSSSSSSIGRVIADDHGMVSSWYEAQILHIDKHGCEVEFHNKDVVPAVEGSNRLPLHLISHIEGTDTTNKEGVNSYNGSQNGDHDEEENEENDDDDDFDPPIAPIVIDEVPLPELRVPGKIIHIWSQRGVYRVSNIERESPLLTKIKLYGNMLTNHLAVSYFDALSESLDVLSASSPPPIWIPFKAATKCQCCRAAFSWNATTTSGVTTSREKHNCRCCGALVCGPCSENQRTVPRVGLNTKVRVCDQCFFNAAALSQQPESQPSSQQQNSQEPQDTRNTLKHSPQLAIQEGVDEEVDEEGDEDKEGGSKVDGIGGREDEEDQSRNLEEDVSDLLSISQDFGDCQQADTDLNNSVFDLLPPLPHVPLTPPLNESCDNNGRGSPKRRQLVGDDSDANEAKDEDIKENDEEEEEEEEGESCEDLTCSSMINCCLKEFISLKDSTETRSTLIIFPRRLPLL